MVCPGVVIRNRQLKGGGSLVKVHRFVVCECAHTHSSVLVVRTRGDSPLEGLQLETDMYILAH